MSKQQVDKGKGGERELAKLLRPMLGETITRNLQQSRDGGGDLNGTRFALEVKRARTPRLNEWWQQTCVQANTIGRIPCLAYRLDRHPWKFMLPLGALVNSVDPTDHDLTTIIGLSEFALIAHQDQVDQHSSNRHHQNPARTSTNEWE